MGEELDWVNVYGPIFMDHLNPTVTFLTNLQLLTVDQSESFTTKQREEAVNDLLIILRKKQHDNGVFADFLHALEKSDQGHIAEFLKTGQTASSNNTIRNRCLIKIFSPELVKVKPDHNMLDYLACLSDEEKQAIYTCMDNHGNKRAALKWLSYLVLKGEEMYGQLLDALDKAYKKYNPKLAGDLKDMMESELSQENSYGHGAVDEKQVRNKPTEPVPNMTNDRDDVQHDGDDLNNVNHSKSTTHPSPPVEPLNVNVKYQEQPHKPKESGKSQESCGESVKDDLPPPQTEELVLRGYQLEIAKPALPGPNGSGQNTIAVAPTGSGKTIVAVKVAQEFLHHTMSVNGASNDVYLPRKVIFLVNQVALADQQSKVFETYLGTDSVMGISGETGSGSLIKSLLDEKSVLVMTAQILENAFRDHQVDFSDIGLLIFDECHNCQKGTPYNKIMARYRDWNLDEKKQIPQILGMTASLDIAQANSQYIAETKILQLCANLDAELISKVHSNECLEELASHQNIPSEEIIDVAGRRQDRFAEESDIIMEQIESMIQSTAEKGWNQLVENDPKLKIPSSRGTQPYEQWVVQFQDAVAVTIQDKDIKRVLMACTDHLKIYNDSLYINRDIRTKDALSRLDKFIEDMMEKEGGFDDTDRNLVNLFKEKKAELQAISENPASRNPVLEMLGTVLKMAFTTTPDVPVKQGILFVKTRAATEAIIKWIEETEDLAFLNPGQLIGSGGSGGMTQHQQIDILKMFREGDHKLIVATSVAQEGLDIAQCNVVVRYNHVSSVVARVQARGRNRAKGGQFFLVVDEQLKLKNKDLMNRIRERMMLKATETIQKQLGGDQTRRETLEQITKLQKEDRSERKLKNVQEASKRQQRISDPVKLTCRKCGEFACHSVDIRSIRDAHHIVISDEFDNQYETKDNAKYPLKVDDLDIQKTLVCAKCKSEWGIEAVYKGMTLPLLKIAGFVVEYRNGKKQRTKKWKDVIFKVKPISDEDLEKVVNIDNDDDEDGVVDDE